jgi:hypothetical protein
MAVRDALIGLHALMDTITDLQRVRIGAPEALTNQVEGWVTLGELEQTVSQRTAGGPIEMMLNLICWFGYDVEGAEETAELELADFYGELTMKLAQNQRGTVGGVTFNLNGSVKDMSLPRPASAPSEYVRYAGRETRIQTLAVLVRLTQPIT